ncbi:MAG TPA: hypothetical protein VMB51_03950 [Solirubrobacteraceae bacterium]|nr:hypothetical protein [Solirubrobacteraceae bacterium]
MHDETDEDGNGGAAQGGAGATGQSAGATPGRGHSSRPEPEEAAARGADRASGRAGAGPAGGEPAGKAPGAGAPVTRGRRILVQVIVWGTTVLAVLAIFAIWANRQLLNPDNWGNTSTRLLQNPAIREATANYLTAQLYANVDVEKEIKDKLPTQIQPLAGPLSGALHSLATEVTQRALASPRVQEVWREANRAADKSFVTIVNGGTGAIAVTHGEVSLDLASILANITSQLGLPDVSSKLPASVAKLKILRSEQIKLVQEGGKALKGLSLLLTILVPVLYALAILLATGFRRRTLMWVGIAAIAAGLIVFLGRNILISQVTDSLVKTESVRPAAQAALTIATEMLSEIAGAFIVIGVPLIAAAWFAGPARLATRARAAIAPFLREQPGWTYGIVAGIMLLIFIWQPIPATGKPAGIIVFLALAFFGTYLLRRQTDAEFPANPDAYRGAH